MQPSVCARTCGCVCVCVCVCARARVWLTNNDGVCVCVCVHVRNCGESARQAYLDYTRCFLYKTAPEPLME